MLYDKKKKKFVTFLLYSIGILRSSNSCPKVTIPANFHAAIDEVRSWERFSKAQPCIPIVWFGLFRKLFFNFFIQLNWQRHRAACEVNWFSLAYSINFTSELERSTTKRPHFVQKSTRTRARDRERESYAHYFAVSSREFSTRTFLRVEHHTRAKHCWLAFSIYSTLYQANVRYRCESAQPHVLDYRARILQHRHTRETHDRTLRVYVVRDERAPARFFATRHNSWPHVFIAATTVQEPSRVLSLLARHFTLVFLRLHAIYTISYKRIDHYTSPILLLTNTHTSCPRLWLSVSIKSRGSWQKTL